MLLLLPLLLGCGRTIAKKPLVQGGSHLRPEAQAVWARPIEISYHFGEEITVTSETISLLGVHVSGDRAQAAGSVNVLGQSTRGLSANSRYAIGTAVDEQDADGFYIVYVEEERAGLLRRVSRSKVRGYLLSLESHGEVSEERADLNRFGHPPADD